MEQKQYCLASYHTAAELGKALDALKDTGVPRQSYSILRFSKLSILPQSGTKEGQLIHFSEEDNIVCDGSFFQDVGIFDHYDTAGNIPIDLKVFFNEIGIPERFFPLYQEALKQGDTFLITYGAEDVIRQHCKVLDGYGEEKPILFLS